MSDSLDDFTWLYRGVPEESPEVKDVASDGEVHPRRPGSVGQDALYSHRVGMTDTGYTSWSTDLETAVELAQYMSEMEGLSGKVVIFRVRIETIDKSRIEDGEAREDEYLIEGTVENVEILEDVADEDNQ